jgi:drug/metabolite transporter (DMT)-like permease
MVVGIGVLDAGATALYAGATRHALLSLNAVAASTYPIATVVLARLFLRERLTPLQSWGAAGALAGVVLMSWH